MTPHPSPRTPQFDCELDAGHLRELVAAFKEVYSRNELALPQDPWEQLRMGIDAVFRCAGHHDARGPAGGAQPRGRPVPSPSPTPTPKHPRYHQHLDPTNTCAWSSLPPPRRRQPRSWMIPRAVKYREINKITGLKGTAVNVQVPGRGRP